MTTMNSIYFTRKNMSDFTSIGNDKFTTTDTFLLIQPRYYMESKCNKEPLRIKPITVSKTLQCEKMVYVSRNQQNIVSISQCHES